MGPAWRAPLLVLGFVALVSAVAGGLVRLGVDVPAPPSGIAWHGALMASAFFGTLISLERAVALGQPWAYLAPLATSPHAPCARRGSRATSLCLLAGYVWLALGGLALASAPHLQWDAVLRVRFPYHALLYIPLALLHVTLALRVMGDLTGSSLLRSLGGGGNAAAIALFIASAAALALGAARAKV